MTVSSALISETQLIDEIRRVVAADPDYVYQGGTCNYLPNEYNSCGCLIGEALTRLGIENSVLQVLDEQTMGKAGAIWGTTKPRAILEPYLALEALRSPWVEYVQLMQDTGKSWSEAVAAADDRGRRRGWVIG